MTRVAVRLALLAGPALVVAGCAHGPAAKGTLASLHGLKPDTQEVRVDESLVKAMQGYQRFLDETPENALTPEAMRRLADLNLEKEFGILGDGGGIVEMAAPAGAAKPPLRAAAAPAMQAPSLTRLPMAANRRGDKSVALQPETVPSSERELELRASATGSLPAAKSDSGMALPDGFAPTAAEAGPLEAIRLYDELLEKYPAYANRDQVLYQKARAYDELGRTEEAMTVMEQLVAGNPRSRYVDEVQFRRAEHFFVARKFREAESAYSAIVAMGPGSEYYELALYKLGWSLYKQDAYEEALDRYFALLDYKVSRGYDFDARHEAPEERRVEDTFQVTSLSFSNLGGPEVIGEYFASHGHRAYEDRVYRYFAEFYLGKRRYNDAATVYRSFVALYPFHAVAPHFSMRTIEIYEAGGFPKLVLESKKAFASSYGRQGEYWKHHDIAKAPEVLGLVKTNLRDLANHYHAQYQDTKQAEDKPANFAEATHWYREFLASFKEDADAPPLNYQLADLLRENGDFASAAREYERTAYEYPVHEKAAAAGYAAIFAHRKHLEVVGAEAKEAAIRQTVASSLRFADTFPGHGEAPTVLAAAAEDLYELKDFQAAKEAGRKLIDGFPNAPAPVRRSAWLVVAHASFEMQAYPDAEEAYTRVLEATGREDASGAGLVDNLAASIYKQGEEAAGRGEFRAAADHYLRVARNAPTSKIRPTAEYDAGAALIKLEDWTAAADVLQAFRRNFPEHELQKEATKQIAFVYRQAGDLSRSAGEYERVAAESQNPELRAESLLLAGDLHEQAGTPDRALAVYAQYVDQFPRPVEPVVTTRYRMAEIYKARSDQARYFQELEKVVKLDAAAGGERTGRTRNLAARSALVLAEPVYERFTTVKLRQPFDKSLQEKQRGMKAVLDTMNGLVAYEVGEVTAAATYYMAEAYSDFSRSLLESERPAKLTGAKLQKYEDELEEEAFPFEEDAIKLHEKNLELIASGVYGPWTEKSLARLAVLKPGRYAKSELSSGFLGSVDHYQYRKPLPPSSAAVEAPASTAPAADGPTADAPPADAAAHDAPGTAPREELAHAHAE